MTEGQGSDGEGQGSHGRVRARKRTSRSEVVEPRHTTLRGRSRFAALRFHAIDTRSSTLAANPALEAINQDRRALYEGMVRLSSLSLLAATWWLCGVESFSIQSRRHARWSPRGHQHQLLCSPSSIPTGNKISLISFSSGGTFFWWQAGAAQWLLENADEDFLTSVGVCGTSAGALTALLFACRVDFDKAADIAIQQVEDRRLFTNPTGLAFVWSDLISEWLDALIPPDDSISLSRLARVSVAATPVSLPPQVCLLTGFSSRQDAMEACLASCHIPFFLDGRGWRLFRGEKFLDGSLWPFLSIPTAITPAESPSTLVVNHLLDDCFVKKIAGVSFLSLITPSSLRDWMMFGRDYMAREHAAGNFVLPLTKAS